jgi:predicted DNA-binding helix-hairpin-helix protein
MSYIGKNYLENKEERKKHRKAPTFAPAGHSTQMIIGASPESDRQIVTLSSGLYDKFALKRVYYSAYIPINEDVRLPEPQIITPLLREHRLYQADWLLRFYNFKADEILPVTAPNLDVDFDPN